MGYIVRDLENASGFKRCGHTVYSKVSEDNKCQNAATPSHTCPYKTEINDNRESCVCCDSCRHECYMDT